MYHKHFICYSATLAGPHELLIQQSAYWICATFQIDDTVIEKKTLSALGIPTE